MSSDLSILRSVLTCIWSDNRPDNGPGAIVEAVQLLHQLNENEPMAGLCCIRLNLRNRNNCLILHEGLRRFYK